VEFVVETTLSVGLPGRSIIDPEGIVKGYGITAETTDGGGEGIVEAAEARGELGLGIGDKMFFGSRGE
jgi:hypothetical protein